jgi:hypothetical protein
MGCRAALTPRRGDRHLAGIAQGPSRSHSLELAEAPAYDLHKRRRRHLLDKAATFRWAAVMMAPRVPSPVEQVFDVPGVRPAK